MPGLGRVAHFDPRNLDHLIADRVADPLARHLAILSARAPSAITTIAPAAFRWWYDSAWAGDQGETSHCTAFAAMAAMADGPITHPGQNPLLEPHSFFEEIRQKDLAAGRDFGGDGATSLAMSQALQARGYIGEYLWGYSLDDFVKAIQSGPVLLGLDWYTSMFRPDAEGIIRAQGAIAGGHEIVANGADFARGLARVKNSWGRSWGVNGHAYLPFSDLATLIAAGGDVLMYRELTTTIANPTGAERIQRDVDKLHEDVAARLPRKP